MKSMSLKLAVAGALTLAGINAMASGLAPAALDATVKLVRIGGATSTDGALGNLMKLASGGPCQPGTLSVFTGSGTGNSVVVYFCQANFSGTGVAVGDKIAVMKESNGGSANGIHNVAQALPLQFINFTSGNQANIAANCTAGADVAAAGDFALFTPYSCTSNASVYNSVAPQFGISDIDPSAFAGIGSVTTADTTTFATGTGYAKSTVAVTFNPAVSTKLFLDLQNAQGLSVNSTTEDLSNVSKLPTLTSSQLRAIFTQKVLLASQLYSNGVQLGTNSADGLVHVCRRGNTSGTMASFKIQFLGEGCSKNGGTINAFGSPDLGDEASGSAWAAPADLASAPLMFAGSGSGDVRACMTYFSNQGAYAVAVISTERRPAVSGASDVYRYVKVDGAEPTLKAVMEGRYEFFTEMSYNKPNGAATNLSTIFDKIQSTIGTNAALRKVNESWQNGASVGQGTALNSGDGTGDVGILAIPTASNFPSFPVGNNQARTSPVNSQRRGNPDLAPNNCNRSFQAYPSL